MTLRYPSIHHMNAKETSSIAIPWSNEICDSEGVFPPEQSLSESARPSPYTDEAMRTGPGNRT